MVQSMTGYGAAERAPFKVEIRSLNHRYMEMSVRMPVALCAHEMPLRDQMKKYFTRGKIDVFVTVASEDGLDININHSAARKVHSALKALHEELDLAGGVDLGAMLNWKEYFLSEGRNYDASLLMEAFHEAAGSLLSMRKQEGAALASVVLDIAERLGSMNERIAALAPESRAASRDKYMDALKEMLRDSQVEESRLLQAATSAVEKNDITEEVARLRSHLSQLASIFTDGGTIGRKLDFLMQELVREVNTMASKSTDGRILAEAVEMKSEIERMREQIQNIQ